MSALAPDARKLVATSGANFWHPAVTEEELENEQLLIDGYRRAMGQKRVAFAIIGVSAVWMLFSYISGKDE